MLLFSIQVLPISVALRLDSEQKHFGMTENLGYALNTPQLAAGMLYFSENDIKGDYEVMGELTAETEDNIFTNAEKMQNKMIDEAKQKGADGIILSGLERRVTGEETATNSETKLKDDKVKSSTKTETSVKEKKTLRGRLIKFKH